MKEDNLAVTKPQIFKNTIAAENTEAVSPSPSTSATVAAPVLLPEETAAEIAAYLKAREIFHFVAVASDAVCALICPLFVIYNGDAVLIEVSADSQNAPAALLGRHVRLNQTSNVTIIRASSLPETIQKLNDLAANRRKHLKPRNESNKIRPSEQALRDLARDLERVASKLKKLTS